MNEGKPQFHLTDFAPVFHAARARNLNPLVVGGHAANFWAYHFQPEEPGLSTFQPFTSKDLDLLGNRLDFLELVRELKAEAKEMRRGAPTPVIGVITFTTPSGAQAQVEMLYSLYGATADELVDGAFEIHSAEMGFMVHVPSPLMCLKTKVSNVGGLPQDHRPDIKHVRMLKLCNRGILRRALRGLHSGTISSRAAINALEAVFRFTQSDVAARASVKHPFDWSRCFPFPELLASTDARIRNFVEHRLRPVFPGPC